MSNMKSAILISVLLVVLCAAVNASVSGGLFRNPKYPGKCALDETMILGPGEFSKNPKGECAMVTCYENGQASIMRCMKQGMREGCTEGKVLYPNAKFPECCKREITCNKFYFSPTY